MYEMEVGRQGGRISVLQQEGPEGAKRLVILIAVREI